MIPKTTPMLSLSKGLEVRPPRRLHAVLNASFVSHTTTLP